MKKKFQNIVFHPFIGSLPIALVVILLMPTLTNRFELELVKTMNCGIHQYYYHDLNGDSLSEFVYLGYEHDNKIGPCIKCRTDISIFEQGRTIDQYNSNRKWLPGDHLKFGDFNGDSIEEIFLFEYSNDSLFIKIIDIFQKNPVISDMFVDRVGFQEGIADFRIRTAGLFDLNHDNYKEFIFSIQAGFSLEPRKLYALDIHNNELIFHDLKYACIGNPKAMSNSNSDFLIVTSCSTPENAPEPLDGTYNDATSYLFAFDENLELLFPPKKDSRKKSGISASIAKIDDELFVDAIFRGETSRDITWMGRFDRKGELLKKIQLDHRNYHVLMNIKNQEENYYLINTKNNTVSRISPDFELVGQMENIHLGDDLFIMDITWDNKDEIISFEPDIGKLIIYQAGFNHPLYLDFPDFNLSTFFISDCRIQGGDVNLYIQNNGTGRFYKYSENILYFLAFLVYPAIYLLISVFLLLLFKFQKRNLQRKWEEQQKVLELELLTIKNQIDPHFTFNAINTLSSIVQDNDHNSAHTFLVDFSTLIRNTLKNSKNISITLRDELDFVKNYLKLQQVRYEDKFDFEIIAEGEIYWDWEVPKMIIQTFSENAIKHGLIHRDTKGQLIIKVSRMNSGLQIEVTDDGIGRRAAGKLGNRERYSTGKGHDIINQVISLYEKIKKVKVSYKIEDLTSRDGISKGTRVIIILPKP